MIVKPDRGIQEWYAPQRIIGEKDAMDKDVLAAIAAAKIGDQVEDKWLRDGDRRLYSLKAAAVVKAPTSQADSPAPAATPTPRNE